VTSTHRRGIDVGGVQLDPAQGGGQRGAHRARAAAQVDDDGRPFGILPGGHRGPAGEVGGLPDQELAAAARYEDPRIQGYPQPAELRPAQDVLEGLAGRPLVHHGGQDVRRLGRGDEQPRLVLGEDTARVAEPADNGRPGMI
jgi:hypothetical protein